MDTIVNSRISMAGQRVSEVVIAGDIVKDTTKLKHKEPINLEDQIQDLFLENPYLNPNDSKKFKKLTKGGKDFGLGYGS